MQNPQSIMRQTKRYTFYESYYGNIYSISQDLKKADIEYFFSSDRKGYNYYGVIVRIFKNRNEEEWESQNVVFEDENLAVIRNHYKEETKTNFFDHIKYLRKEDYILKQSNPKYGYWTDSDWGTYEYTASELKIYFKSNIETIGEIDGKDYSQVFKEQFEVLHSKYINDLPLVTFCAKQHIPMEHELLISWLFGNGFPPVLEWGTPYSPEITIFDIGHFCEGADVTKMLKDIPMHLVSIR